ncbi:MAG TPA: adenylate cyclase [Candidatus Dormibacteraeota bacterium]|nr:adenylate cyclase [Candidatus Dormibacteraeota bacterium]
MRSIRGFAAGLTCAAAIALFTATPAFALITPTTGQPGAPNNTCGPANPTTPGNAVNAAGSVFNPNGQAGTVYAGNAGTASAANANSAAAVSQYDTACVRLSH